MTASVPELTARIRRRPDIAPSTSSASSNSRSWQAPNDSPSAAARRTASTTVSGACPWMSGPHDRQ